MLLCFPDNVPLLYGFYHSEIISLIYFKDVYSINPFLARASVRRRRRRRPCKTSKREHTMKTMRVGNPSQATCWLLKTCAKTEKVPNRFSCYQSLSSRAYSPIDNASPFFFLVIDNAIKIKNDFCRIFLNILHL